MRYNYYYLCLHVLFLLGLVTSCSNDIDYTYKGSNYIQISTADDPAIAENDDRPVTVDVLLATAVETDATIHFELSGNEDGVLNMENDGNVLIKAGEKKASFKVASNHKGLIKAQRSMTLKVKGYTDPRMQAWRDLKLIVKPSVESPTLTEEQLELIKGYKEKYGLDLNQFIGVLKCNVEIRYPEGDIGTFYDEETRSFEGKSVITLSDNATAERPILKMIDNPMGLTSFLWEILQKETIEEESWAANEWNQCMLTAIGFDRDKEEFEVTLDNLELLLEERSISFLGTVLDNYDEPIISVPFKYSFTAWNRWKQKADNGEKVAVPDGDELEVVNIRLVKEPSLYSEQTLDSPQAVVELMAKELSQYDREVFCILNMKNNGQVINMNLVSVGTINASLVIPREVFKSSILANASAII